MKGTILKVVILLAVLVFVGYNVSLSSEESSVEDPIGKVTIAIEGPSDVGKILETTEVEIEEDDKVLDVLTRITRKEEIQMEYRGSGGGAYVEGIDNLYEFDRGSESGWMYSINGRFPNRSAGVWPTEPGEHIEWVYTKDLGEDVGASVEDGLWDGEED